MIFFVDCNVGIFWFYVFVGGDNCYVIVKLCCFVLYINVKDLI